MHSQLGESVDTNGVPIRTAIVAFQSATDSIDPKRITPMQDFKLPTNQIN